VRGAVLVFAATLVASPADIAGTWKVKSNWPEGPGLKTVGAIILDLRRSGTTITGTAQIGSLPGLAPIAAGRIDGDRVIFDATGHLDSTTGIPTCHFEATVVGDEMLLTMTFTRNSPVSQATAFKFSGAKQLE
jgi:hypothetical protein